MSQYAINGTTPRAPQVASPPRPAHSATPPRAPSSAPASPDAAELLARLLLDSRPFAERKRATDDHIEKCKGEARDEAVRKIEGKLHAIEGRLAEHAELFELVQEEVVGIQDRLTAATNGIGGKHAELEAGLGALRQSLSSGHAALAGAIASCERDITVARADVCHLEERLGDLDRKIETRLGVIDAALAEDRTAPLAARLDLLADDMERLGRRATGQEARLAETAGGLLACREEIAEFRSTLAGSDARALSLEDQLTTLQRSLQELLEQLARDRHEREQRSIKARLARLIDSVRWSLAGFRRRRCGA